MKKLLKYIFYAVAAFLVLIIGITIYSIPSDKEMAAAAKVKQDSLARVYNIDTLIAQIKKDTTYKVKDVYYNKVDSRT